MTNTFADTYKDSGIEWIGKIPEDWDLLRLQFCIDEIKENNNPIKSSQVLSLVKDKGVMLYEEKGNVGNVAKEDITEYKLAYPNTLILNSMNILIGSVGISNYFGCVSPVYYVFRETNNSDLRFINYIFTTQEFQKELRRYANGIMEIRLRVSAQDIFKRKIAIPTKQNQTKISDYLDKKCGDIDRVVEIEKEVIEKLKEYKQSIITEAATKGLDKSVPLKDSGIEWIDKIPKEWKIKKLKYACNNRNENYSNKYGALEYFALENIESKSAKFVHTENNYDILQSQICKENDIIFGKLRPYLAKVYQVPKLSCCSGEFAIFCNFEGIADYYKYVMLSNWFINIVDASTYGTKMPRANMHFIKNMDIVVPTTSEQQEIVNYLDKKCSEIDKAISDKEQIIEKLTEYKKSLIYECVTGKKRVI